VIFDDVVGLLALAIAVFAVWGVIAAHQRIDELEKRK
jgi:hypothetical protein